MAEVAPAPAAAAPAKASKKKAASKPKKAGPSVGDLIVKAVSASKERSGVSLAAPKKALVAAGYDVEKNNSALGIKIVDCYAALPEKSPTRKSSPQEEGPSGTSEPLAKGGWRRIGGGCGGSGEPEHCGGVDEEGDDSCKGGSDGGLACRRRGQAREGPCCPGGSSEEEEQPASNVAPRMKHTTRFRWRNTETAGDFPDRAGFIREVIFRKLGLAGAQVVCIQRNGPQRFVDVTVLA
ncbi:histone H1.2-like [Scleropages formosus]|uniref:histone H1.2-like n=1 Tax=Scleropages formosus TaxID=113540 RepID=UPI0010FA9E36|nr:histone H1.2-like [Scleropages formosus]